MKKIKFFILITVFVAACAAIGGLFSFFSNTTDISDEILYETAVSFIPDDGSGGTVIPGDKIYEQEIRFDGVYKTVYVVDGDFKALSIIMGAGEAEIEVDGETVFSGTVPQRAEHFQPLGDRYFGVAA